MHIRIRKEKFGYVLFDRETREHYFVNTQQTIESLPEKEIFEFLRNY